MNKKLIILSLLSMAWASMDAQVIEKREAGEFDSSLLAADCRLNEESLGKVFNRLEILADFPGSAQKWFEFANSYFDFDIVVKTLSDTIHLFDDSVIMKFVVTREGNICNISFKKGNPILEGPASKLLRLSPPWKPGINGGRLLNSYRTLRIDVFIDREKNIKRISKYRDSYLIDNDKN